MIKSNTSNSLRLRGGDELFVLRDGAIRVRKNIRLVSLIAIDVFLVATAIYMSYMLRFDFDIRADFEETIPYVIMIYSPLTIASLYMFKIYKRVWQHASIGDLISIIRGVTLSTLLFIFIHEIVVDYFYQHIVIPRSIYLLSTMTIIVFIGSSRFIWRLFRDNYMKIQPYHKRALIIGADEAGVSIARELKQMNSECYPVAFIDRTVQSKGLEILGVPVVGGYHEIEQSIKEYNVQDIIIALPMASRLEIAEVLELCKSTGCQIKIVPQMKDIIDGKVSVDTIRNVSIEDLLGREPVQVYLGEITNYLSDKVVLVTGAGGSIGSELCRQIAPFSPQKLVLLGHGENSIYQIDMELRKAFPQLIVIPLIADIQDAKVLEKIFEEHRPEVVFHAAAHKHVPMMESNPTAAFKNNVIGTKNLAECSSKNGVERFVMISTDKAVNPTNVMGATKRLAEMLVQSLDKISNTQFSAVRFGNVLGSRGSVIPLFQKQIREGGPVTVTHPEMIRYFMTIPEASQLVIQAGAFAQGGEVFILDMGRPVKIADLARDLIRLSGLEPYKDIEIVYTGIRPGEKLFEEILMKEEGTSATKHDRIFVGKPLEFNYEQIATTISSIEAKLNRGYLTNGEIKKHLCDLVPTYKPFETSDLDELNVTEAVRASLEMVTSVESK